MLKPARRRFATLVSLSLVGIALVFSANRVAAQSDLQYGIITDSYGNLVGQLAGNGVSVNSAGTLDVSLNTYTAVPAGVTMSTLAPAVTPTSTVVKISVPATAMIGFCTSGNYYDKHTGQCADGKFPYKIVQASALSAPAAQIPNIACAAPRVPTFYLTYTKWTCLVPTGFKLSVGN